MHFNGSFQLQVKCCFQLFLDPYYKLFLLSRWFHDGCCECVGHTCINYGINESRCLECPGEDEDNPTESETFGGEDYENGEEKDGKGKGIKTEEKVAEKQVEVPPAV